MQVDKLQDKLISEPAWKVSFLRTLLMVCPFSFALDYKSSSGGGTLSQIGMAVASAAIFVSIFLAGRLRPTRAAGLALVHAILITMLGFGVGALYQAPFEFAIRVGFPFLLFVTGLWAGSVAANSLIYSVGLYRGMVLAGVVSLFFRFYYSTSVDQIDLDEMRYQVLSPVLCSLIAYVCASACYSRRIKYSAFIVLVATGIVVLLSVTRSYVLAMSFTVIILPLIVLRLSRKNPAHAMFARARRSGILLLIGGAVVAILFAVFLRGDVITSWADRLYYGKTLTHSGEDVNYVTRLAEVEGIWNSASKTPWTFLFGNGFGNSYEWAIEYVGDIESVSGDMVFAFWAPTWSSGHSPFNYALFFGGVTALIWQISVFLWPMVSSWSWLARLRSTSDEQVLQLVVFHTLSIWLYFSQSLTANPFGERMSALYMGISVSTLLSLSKLFGSGPTIMPGSHARGLPARPAA